MPNVHIHPLNEAKDSLARVERAWRGQTGTILTANGFINGNMDQEAVQRCVKMETIRQLKNRIRRLSGR